MRSHIFLLFVSVLTFIACQKENSSDINTNEKPVPIVFMHGLLASGDTYANQMMRFHSNDYDFDRMFAYDYNTLSSFDPADLDIGLLDDFIDDVLQKTGADQVNLVGHSMGGSYGYLYLSDSIHAAKVAHYVHVGSGTQDTSAGPTGNVPTMNIYSLDDKVTAGADIPGTVNVALTQKDHYEVATCEESFMAMYKFFNNNESPVTSQISAENNLQISGKVLTLGENEPNSDATVNVYELNAATGQRLSMTPVFNLSINAKGEWGPKDVAPDVYYEFEVIPGDVNDRIVHYYREPFIHSNPLVYLRTLPPPTGIAGLLVGSLPKDDNQTVVVLFTANKATIVGRDSLSINSMVLSTQEFCSAENTTIAFFLYDDGDSQTSLNGQGAFSSFPFLEGADIFLPANPLQSIQCRFNGRNLFIRNWKSKTEGVSIAVFD